MSDPKIKFFIRKPNSQDVDSCQPEIPSNWTTRQDGELKSGADDLRGGANLDGYKLTCSEETKYVISKTTENGTPKLTIPGFEGCNFDPAEDKFILIEGNKCISYPSQDEMLKAVKESRKKETLTTYDGEHDAKISLGVGGGMINDLRNPALPNIAPTDYPNEAQNPDAPNAPKDPAFAFNAHASVYTPLIDNKGQKQWYSYIPLSWDPELFFATSGPVGEDRMGFAKHTGYLRYLTLGLLSVGLSAHRLYDIFTTTKKDPSKISGDLWIKTDLLGLRWYDIDTNIPGLAPAKRTTATELLHPGNTPNVTVGVDLKFTEVFGLGASYEYRRFNGIADGRKSHEIHAGFLNLNFYIPRKVEVFDDHVTLADAKPAKVITPIAPPPPPEPEPVPEPQPEPPPPVAPIPGVGELGKLPDIKIREQMVFEVKKAKLVKGPTGEGKLPVVKAEIERKIKEAYPNGVPEGSIVEITVVGHASSEDNFDKNQVISANRANTIRKWLLDIWRKGQIGALKDVEVDENRVFAQGVGEKEPLDLDGKVIKWPFGGYEARGNKNKPKEGQFTLCLEPGTKPEMSYADCKEEFRAIEDMIASRYVEINIKILPPTMKASATVRALEASADDKSKDVVQARKITDALIDKKSKKPKFAGVTDIFYNESDNSINFVIDENGYKSITSKPSKNKGTLKDSIFNSIKKLHTTFTSAFTFRFVLNHSNPPENAETILHDAIYDFSSWPFKPAGIDVQVMAEKFSKGTVAAKAREILGERKEALLRIISGNTFETNGYSVTALPVANISALTEEEVMMLQHVAKTAGANAKQVSAYYMFSGDENQGLAVSISNNVIRQVYPTLERYNSIKDGNLKSSYVVIITGDNKIDMSSTEDANAAAIRQRLFEALPRKQ